MIIQQKIFSLLALAFCLLLASASFVCADDAAEADKLNRAVVKMYNEGKYQEALPDAEKALAFCEKALGPEHLQTATALDNLAHLYYQTGVYDKAEKYYRRVLMIYNKKLGARHKSVADAVTSLCKFYLKTRNYKNAEALVKEFLAFREKELGPEHPDTQETLHLLYAVYKEQGDYRKAEPIFKRITATVEKTNGAEHPRTALYLNNLAMLYYQMGFYDQAEGLLKRALAIREKTLGAEHLDTAQSLGDLATLYATIGSSDKAEPLYRRSLAIHEKLSGPEHPDTAIVMNNLGTLYSSLGLDDQAYPLYRQSLSIAEKAFGPQSFQLAGMLDHLATLYNRAGYYKEAMPLLKRSLSIREKTFGADHPGTAGTMSALALLYLNMGENIEAETLYKKALAIRQKMLGEKHPDTAVVMSDLALLYASLGRNQEALDLFDKVLRADREQITQIMGFASADQQQQFLSSSNANFYLYLNLIYRHFPDDPGAADIALHHWLDRKGLLLETQQRIQDFLAHDPSPQAREVFNKLVETRQELAALAMSGAGLAERSAGQKRMAELNSEKDDLEAQLSRLSKTYARKRLSWFHIRSWGINAILPRNSLLVDMIKIRDYDFKTRRWLDERYLAFTLTPAAHAKITLVDLGEAKTIDEKISLLKKAVRDTKSSQGKLAKLSAELYQLAFAPLKKAIGVSRQIFLSPDGSLNLIPFEILRDEEGKYLIDTYKFNYISAGRDITIFGLDKEKGKRHVLIGDPDFDLAAQVPQKNSSVAARSRSMQGIVFSRLPGTRAEVKAIGGILGQAKCDIYLGREARETVLHGKDSPEILHLATHGFFLSDQDWASLMDDKNKRGVTVMEKGVIAQKTFTGIENPLLRSGLALAGANKSLAQDAAAEGILTAEKIIGLNLVGTELVVLSACETGVGEVRSGEGVYGLRRAFAQAGAKRLVMSMWEVPDQETKELMVGFYRNLQKGSNYADALRQAILSQRAIVKKRYGYDHPFYWGAFVFLGDPL